jgi:hypothetical protein
VACRPLGPRSFTLLRDPHIYSPPNLSGERRGGPLSVPFERRDLFGLEENLHSCFR